MKKPTAWVLTAEDDVSIQAVFYRIHFKMEDNMELLNLSEELKNNAYPGRGIVIGKTPDGKQAVTAYFIMGRSSNSRNRVFVEEGEGIRTQAFDPSKLEDPSLIIYAPVRVLGNKTIVTNGDQTDTIYEGMDKQLTFEQSLRSREFEPDGPNYTPRISGILHIENGGYNFAMSILKSDDGDPSSCLRYTFAYENPKAGEGRFIHTYMHDGNPLPSFSGEPKKVAISGDIDSFTQLVWESLNEENKVSLFVRHRNRQIRDKNCEQKPLKTFGAKRLWNGGKNERNSVKVRMQPESEAFQNFHGRWQRPACYRIKRQARIYQFPGCIKRLAACFRVKKSNRTSGSNLF